MEHRDCARCLTEMQEDTPSLTDDVIRGLWERALRKAHREAESDTDQMLPRLSLTWEEVFTAEYTLNT